MREFLHRKEWEEEATYSNCIKMQQTYNPPSNGRIIWGFCIIFCPFSDIGSHYYFTCCRNAKVTKKKKKKRKTAPHQKETRKLNSTCISRMYVDELRDGQISVKYVSTHTGHNLGPQELQHLPPPESTKQEVANTTRENPTR